MPRTDPDQEALAILHDHKLRLTEVRLVWERLTEQVGGCVVEHLDEALEAHEKMMRALGEARTKIVQDTIKREID